MKLGVSSTILFDYVKQIENIPIQNIISSDMIKKMIQELINFAIKNKFEYIEFPGFDAPFDKLFQASIEEIKQMMDVIKINFTFHASFFNPNLGSLDEEIRKISVNKIKEAIDSAAYLNIEKVTVHPRQPRYCSIVMPFLHEKVKQMSILSIEECNKYAEDIGCQLLVENIAKEDLIFIYPHEFSELENFRFTIDTAHSATAGVDPSEFVEVLGNRIKNVHLGDAIFGQTMEGLKIGDGEINFEKFFKELKKINYKETIILELNSRKDVLESLDEVRRLMR